MWGNAEMGARLAANANAIVTLLLVVGPPAKLPLGCAFEAPLVANMTNPASASFSLCTAEWASCQSDPDCVECVDNRTLLDCYLFFSDCDGVWDILCCRFGAGTCKFNEALFEYVDCAHDEDTAACPASNLCGDRWCTRDPTCGNSFDYDGANACSSSEGPALSSTLCSTGTNGCDASLCCAPDETCADYTGGCTLSYQDPALDDVAWCLRRLYVLRIARVLFRDRCQRLRAYPLVRPVRDLRRRMRRI